MKIILTTTPFCREEHELAVEGEIDASCMFSKSTLCVPFLEVEVANKSTLGGGTFLGIVPATPPLPEVVMCNVGEVMTATEECDT